MHRLRLLLIAALIPALAGCATVGYYAQALSGQLDVVGRARPIEELLADRATAPELKRKLERVLAIRTFASAELGLPDNDSYRRYADLERPFALWNVFATPELSLRPKEWCFLLIGCVAYRGYFRHAAAEALAGELRAAGYDVYLGGVVAYSTLGWFDDPMLNTVIARPEPEMAGLIFHELAHQTVYARDDSAFNESFAMTVELEGVRRWLARAGSTGAYAEYAARQQRRAEFTQLVLKHRARLETLYASNASDDEKRAGKRAVLEELRAEYRERKKSWAGYNGYDTWFAQDLNNAHLAAVGLYHQHVEAFRRMLERHGGDWQGFYAEAKRLAKEPKARRAQLLAELSADMGAAISAPPRTEIQE